MKTLDDGGPAFPRLEVLESDERDEFGRPERVYRAYSAEGTTLRDYFAAKAMAAIILADGIPYATASADEHARAAYINADAMLAARTADSGKGE